MIPLYKYNHHQHFILSAIPRNAFCMSSTLLAMWLQWLTVPSKKRFPHPPSSVPLICSVQVENLFCILSTVLSLFFIKHNIHMVKQGSAVKFLCYSYKQQLGNKSTPPNQGPQEGWGWGEVSYRGLSLPCKPGVSHLSSSLKMSESFCNVLQYFPLKVCHVNQSWLQFFCQTPITLNQSFQN